MILLPGESSFIFETDYLSEIKTKVMNKLVDQSKMTIQIKYMLVYLPFVKELNPKE
jgi:hypothetical protein